MYLAQLTVIDFIEKSSSDFIRYATETNVNKMTIASDRRYNRDKTPAQIRADHAGYGRIYANDNMLVDLLILNPDINQAYVNVPLNNAVGVVYIIDCHDRSTFPAVANTIRRVRDIVDLPLLLIATGLEASPLSSDTIQQIFELPEHSIIRDCDLQNTEAVRDTILALLYLILTKLEE